MIRRVVVVVVQGVVQGVVRRGARGASVRERRAREQRAVRICEQNTPVCRQHEREALVLLVAHSRYLTNRLAERAVPCDRVRQAQAPAPPLTPYHT